MLPYGLCCAAITAPFEGLAALAGRAVTVPNAESATEVTTRADTTRAPTDRRSAAPNIDTFITVPLSQRTPRCTPNGPPRCTLRCATFSARNKRIP